MPCRSWKKVALAWRRGLRLAEEAASDNSGTQEILERMLGLIQDIAQSAYAYGNRVQDVAAVAESMHNALDELNFSVARHARLRRN